MVADSSEQVRRRGRRARAAQETPGTQTAHSTTGDLALFARRSPVPLPPVDSALPQITRFNVPPISQLPALAQPKATPELKPKVEPEIKITQEPVIAQPKVETKVEPEVDLTQEFETEADPVSEWVVADPETELPTTRQFPPAHLATAPLPNGEIPTAQVGTKKSAWFAPEVFAKSNSAKPKTNSELAGSAEQKSPAIYEAETKAFIPISDERAARKPNGEVTPRATKTETTALPEPKTGLAPAPKATTEAANSNVTDWYEVGDLSADQAPEPVPAPRFDGKVLNKPSRTAGGIGVWIAWILVALVVAALIWLVANGTIGPGLISSAPSLELFNPYLL